MTAVDSSHAPVLGPATDVWGEVVRDDPWFGPAPVLVVLTDTGSNLDVQLRPL